MSDQSRRKLLKSIAAGSGAIVAGKSLPESWSRPVVDSVMLPAHAQTSCQAVDDEFTIVSVGSQVATGSVPAPGVLANDSCTQVVDPRIDSPITGSGNPTPSIALTLNADGSFNYSSDQPVGVFTFTYTTESGATANVIVNMVSV
jgi:hypothetical protein